MDNFFNPQSIAVIGASRDPKKLGYQLLANIINNGYGGHIYPVNPKAETILNLPAFAKIGEVPEAVEVAIVVVPAPIVPAILAECGQKNVAFAVVVSAGFAEIGPAGGKLQDEIAKIMETSAMRIVGPNCLGFLNATAKLNATFAAPALMAGNVSAVFQSGALGVALFDWAQKYNFGFSKFVSLGNKMDLEEAEIIDFLQKDPQTKVIALYLEQIANPLKFLNVCQATTLQKPIIVLKGGTTDLGAKAAFSHTASMVGSAQTTKAIFAQSNLIVAKTIEEMINLIQVLSSEPPVSTPSLAIVTNAGGPAILATDMADRVGIAVPEINQKEQKNLQKILPAAANSKNPIDLLGDAKAKDYAHALNFAIGSPDFGAVLALLTPQTATEVEETAKVLSSCANAPKPVIASFLGDRAVQKGVEILRSARVPHFDDPELAVYALSKIVKYYQKVKTPHYLVELEENPAQPLPPDALSLACSYNIPVPRGGMATNMAVATQIVQRIGFPVAVKNISPQVVHKFKAGKVILNVPSEAYLKEAIKKVGWPVLIQKMADLPFEVIVGAHRDPRLGTLVSFGWGGIFTEDLQDLASRILPLTENDLDEMIKETKIGKVLRREKVNLSLVKNILIEVCQIMVDFPQIAELDLNPIKLSANEAICVDARFKIVESK